MNAEERAAALRDFKVSAFRLEQQPRYADTYGDLDAWLAGDRPDPASYLWHQDWLANVRAHTEAGRSITRVRIVEDPPTDYQAWSRYVASSNVEAGEDIRYLTRGEASAQEVFPPLGDFWLLDDDTVIAYYWLPDGSVRETEVMNELAPLARSIRDRLLAVAQPLEVAV